jgi:hypothetical protein
MMNLIGGRVTNRALRRALNTQVTLVIHQEEVFTEYHHPHLSLLRAIQIIAIRFNAETAAMLLVCSRDSVHATMSNAKEPRRL